MIYKGEDIMRVQKKWMLIIACLLGSATVAAAQERPAPKADGDDVIYQNQRVVTAPLPPPPPGQEGDVFVFVSSEMSVDGKVVKNAPYSAEAVTETVQTLGDGNRIVRKNSATVYRDSEGRTRREETLRVMGPWATNGEPPRTVFVNDPVAGVNYILEARTRTARKLPSFDRMRPGAAGRPGVAPPPPPQGQFQERMPAPPPGEFGIREFVGGPGTTPEAKTESLGKQMVEGVMADGTRKTVTIPAGQIGNEKPIVIVSERWYSPELQAVVMTKRSDPLAGETTYRLTNINRTEPARTLFEVPSDYTIKEGPAPGNFQIRVKKPGEYKSPQP
jgi:hypothetical protein